MSESGRVTAAPGSVLPELGCTPINGPIDDKQSVDLDGAVHVQSMCVCLCVCVYLSTRAAELGFKKLGCLGF